MFYYLFHTSARLSWEGITRWYEDSLLKEILDYVNRQWFTVDLEAYEYIPVNENTAGNIRSLVLGFMFGSMISIFPGLPSGALNWVLSVVAVAVGVSVSCLFKVLGKKFNVE
jgi:hypothetical protein